MNNIQKLKHNFINASIVLSSLLFTIPNLGNSIQHQSNPIINPYATDLDSIIDELFRQANRKNIAGIEWEFKCIAEMLKHSDDALTDSCKFLQSLLNKMNTQYGILLKVSELLQLTRESIYQFPIPKNELEKYMVGLDLIDLHQSTLNELEWLGLIHLAKHHKDNSFWTWLTVATVTAAAVTLCIVLPEVAPAVISGAVEVGKAAVGK